VSELVVIPLRIRVGKRFVITIPKEVREKLNIKEGDELDLLVINDSVIIRKSISLIEFIDSIKPKGSVKTFLKEREKEGSAEYERVEGTH